MSRIIVKAQIDQEDISSEVKYSLYLILDTHTYYEIRFSVQNIADEFKIKVFAINNNEIFTSRCFQFDEVPLITQYAKDTGLFEIAFNKYERDMKAKIEKARKLLQSQENIL